MRVAVLCDVHGNLPALEAVLAEVASLEVDRVVSGGDLVSGPFPRECLERLVDLGAVFVHGNADRDLGEWIEGRLDPVALEFVAGWPHPVSLDGVLYCHGSPRDENEILTRVSPDVRFRAALADVEERLVVGGHTHVQFECELDGIRFVNAGSVGMPYEGRPGAFWALLDGDDVDLRRTAYGVDAAVAAFPTDYSWREEHVKALLEPPDPGEISAYFEGRAT